MKAEDLERALVLKRAEEQFEAFEDDLTKNEEPNQTWDYVGMRIGVGDLSMGDGDFHCINQPSWIDLDKETALKLLPKIRELITSELATMGIITRDPK